MADSGGLAHTTDRRARIAGAVYLLSVVPGVFSLMYVPGALIVRGDVAATVARIASSETLFRWGMAAEVASAVVWIFVTQALYRLLADVDRAIAWLMVALSLMAVPVMLANVLPEMALLGVLDGGGFGGAFTPVQRAQVAGALLRSHEDGFTIAGVFWGLWLFPFAMLVWRSGFLPRVFAVLLAIGGLGYLGQSLTDVLAPGHSHAIGRVASIATSAGELPIMVWLLLAGARSGGMTRPLPRGVA